MSPDSEAICFGIILDPCLINYTRWDSVSVSDFPCVSNRIDSAQMSAIETVSRSCAFPSGTPTPKPAEPPAACAGDCNADRIVLVSEILKGVNIALGEVDLSDCSAFDANGDGLVTIDELLAGVRAALGGCPPTAPAAY